MSKLLFSRRCIRIARFNFSSEATISRQAVKSICLCAAVCGGLLFAGFAKAAPPTPDLLKQPPVGSALVKIRAVTHGPKFHWFGYYNKHQFDPTGRYLLAAEVDFEHRLPKPEDTVKIGMVDLADGDKWIELGQSRAWCWQQGCMLQWRPGSKSEILFNDREGGHYVCRVLDVKTRKLRTLPMPIEDVTDDGKLAVTADFRRIFDIRAGYGYAAEPDPNRNVLTPDNTGVWSMDMETGETKLIISIAQLAKIPYPESQPKDKHYVNHLEFSPDGKRFLMFNRWVGGVSGQPTRVFTAAPDGSDVRLLSERGASHWVWRDSEHVLFWALGGYKLYRDDGSGKPVETLWNAPNGHESYIPGTNDKWLVTDTYPQGSKREQILYLFHLPTSRAFVLGKFPMPKEYSGEWRCDLHPRLSNDGKMVVIDSPHGGNGRQQYVIDISRIVAGENIGKEALAEPVYPDRTAEVPAGSATRPIPPPGPRDSEIERRYQKLQSRLAELRKQFEPYLRSLPKPLDVRSQTPISSEWRSKFEVAKATEGVRPEPPEWFREDFADSGWEKTTVPEWRYEGEAYRTPISCILWYRTQFPTPKRAAPGRRIFLVFGGVDWEAEVWLNGKKLGGHVGYYEPFRFDVTDLLKEKNTLAVRIIQGPLYGEPRSYNGIFPMPPAKVQRYVSDRAQSVVGFRNNDLFLGGGVGIHREVYLETAGEARIAAVFARAKPETQQADVTVETDAAAAKRVVLDVQLLPENFEGRSYKNRLVCELPRGAGKQTFTIPMPGAKTWSPEAPNLYRCRVICRVNLVPDPSYEGEIIDAQDVLIGSRSFDLVSKQRPREGFPEGMFLLNGKPLYLRGTNIQGLNALVLWKESDRLMDAALMLKAANFNAVRACQFVCFPEIRELFDRLGILSEQDQGSGRPPLNVEQLPHTGTLLARTCYNNPGVVLFSFGNETHFDPTKTIRAILAVDPERIVIPISGNYAPKGGPLYPIPEELWANIVHDYHAYSAWYSGGGMLWGLLKIQPPKRLVVAGEYGAEGLDSYETMTQHYPLHWKAIPPANADVIWANVQTVKADARQLVGFRGTLPKNLGQYIEASQNYQADVVAEVSKGFRLSPRAIGGYFQYHFIDVLAANWPKTLVSHDMMPKKAYYAMAEVNRPLVPLFQVLGRGEAMELWVANDLPQPFSACRLQWTVETRGKALLEGEKPVEVPAGDAVSAGRIDLAKVPADVDLITIRLALSDAAGKTLSTYEQEIFLRVWREQNRLLELAKEKAAK